MDWSEIKIEIATADIEKASAIANMAVPYGIYIEDYSDLEVSALEIAHIDLIDEDLLNKDRNKAIIHIYISEEDNAAEAVSYLTERFNSENIKYNILTDIVKDTDWNENWKKYFKAFEVGNRLAVVPGWEKYENSDNRMILSIDPGAAFGTGTHATTWLCLNALDKYVKPGDSLLDIGCGSGILAIAGALLGCEECVGVDIDKQSVKTATENAHINNISQKCSFVHGDLVECISGKYDIICANIVADVILRLFKDIKSYVKAGTIFIISGIIDVRSKDIEAGIEEYGFNIEEKLTRDNWCAYIIKFEESVC